MKKKEEESKMINTRKTARVKFTVKTARIVLALVMVAAVSMPTVIFADFSAPVSEAPVDIPGNAGGQPTDVIEEVPDEVQLSDLGAHARSKDAIEELPDLDIDMTEIFALSGGADVTTPDYEYIASSGTLTIKTDAATDPSNSINWHKDMNIGATEAERGNNIVSVVVESGVTVIDNYAFSACSNLVSVDFSNAANLRAINYTAFSTCPIQSVDLRKCTNLTSIGDHVFENCASLDTALFPTSLQTIGLYAFCNCTSLTNVNFNECINLTAIYSEAFNRCGFANVDFSACTSLKLIGNSAFYQCKNLTSVILPPNLEEIGSQLFYQCEKLAGIVFPENLKKVGYYAFAGCIALNFVQFRGTTPPPTFSFDVFYNVPTHTLYCPKSVAAAYENWVTANPSSLLGWTVVGVSSDAGISKVANQPITAGSQAGTVSDPKTASVSVAGSQGSIGTFDIDTSDLNARPYIYSDSTFSANVTGISLPIGGGSTHVYVKVVAEDTVTTLYYDVTVTVPDTLSPVPGTPVSGSIGDINATNVTQTSLTLNWAAATDNVTAAANLKYYVYTSIRNNISSVTDCRNNGTLLNPGGMVNITSFSVGGLPPNTTYYFNVLVEDEEGNCEVYMAANATTLATPTVTPTPPAVPAVYTVLKQFDDFTGSGTSTARVDADHKKFVRLMLGGAEIAPSNYTITQGSTVITLHETHLKTYANGTYMFKAEYTDGESEDIRLLVNVQGTANHNNGGTAGTGGATPRTGDGMNLTLWWGIGAFALVALGTLCVFIWRKRRSYKA